MKHFFRKFLLCSFTLLFLFFSEQKVFALTLVAPENVTYTPIILTADVTDRTKQLEICVYDDTTLYIENGSETIFQKRYKSAGRKNVTIAPQKAETTLSVYLVAKSSGKRGKTLKIKVTKAPEIATEPLDSSIAKPVIQKTITTKTKNVSVIASKGTTLYIKNDKKTVKKVNFNKNGEKKIHIPQQDSGNLYFYVTKGNARSEIVCKKVLDVTAPKKPTVKRSVDGTTLTVKGEIGADVYLKINNGKWKYINTITDKHGIHKTILGKYSEDVTVYCSVKLKDSAGNESAVTKITLPYNLVDCPAPI